MITYAFDESTVYAQNLLYSPLGQLQVADFGNNTKTTMSYDSFSYRLTNILNEKVGTPNVTLQDISYQYDKVSNVIEREDQKNIFTETYAYDDLHRLTSSNLGGTSKVWGYDEIGNILNNNGVAYSYDSSRKQIVEAVGLNTYGFDAFGNISMDGSRVYGFDWDNRLRSVTKSSQTTTYDYDEEGLRVVKSTPSLVTTFIDKFTELRGSDVVRHIYANDKMIASIDELNQFTYNHSDHLGSSNIKTDGSGNVVKRIEYLPFGDKRMQSGSYDNIKNRFTGQFEDEESGLYYYQQRYYDPVLSRFISADPLYSEEMDKRGINSQELNLYSYVGNNPINRIDPNGTEGVGVNVGFTVNVPLFRFSYNLGANIVSDPNKSFPSNLSASVTQTYTDRPATVTVGAGASVNGALTYTNASNVSQLTGPSTGSGASIGVGPLSGGFEVSKMLDPQGNQVLNSSGNKVFGITVSPFGAGMGAGVEVYGDASYNTSEISSVNSDQGVNDSANTTSSSSSIDQTNINPN